MTPLIIIFLIGYLFIIFERNVNVDKAAFSLLTGVACWVFLISNSFNKEIINHQLTEGLGEKILDDIIDSIKRWEDRIVVDENKCVMEILNDENSIIITIPYRIVRTGQIDVFKKKIYQ